MPSFTSFTTVNKVDENGFICKYDVYKTREEADARIVELHQMAGYEDAFVVDNGATAVNNKICFQMPKYWPVDKVNKTVSFDKDAYDTDNRNSDMATLREERNRLLKVSDVVVYPDRWANMNDDTKTKWSNYRQELRDLPASKDALALAQNFRIAQHAQPYVDQDDPEAGEWTPDPSITWPTEPA